MHINLILIPFVIILGLIMGSNDTPKNRKWYIILCSAVLLFVAAMRSPEWMTYTYNIDTLNYQGYFENAIAMDWGEFWHAVVLRYAGIDNDADVGFMGLQKLIGLLTDDFYIYSLIADLLFFVPFGMILYRYTTSMKQIIFAFIFYISLVQIYFLGGARQIFAMGFDLMALLAIIDRKKLLTVLLFLVGVSIHFSSILFAVPLLMIWFKTNPRLLKLLHVVCFALFPIVLMMPNEIIVFMGEASGWEKYAAYGEGAIQGGASTFIILIEALSLFCLFAIRQRDLVKSETMKNFYVMAPLFTLLAPLIRANGSMTRISLYYYLFLTLLVPYAIDCAFKKGDNKLAYVLAIGALSFLTVMGGGMRYFFYWQV